MTVTHHRRSVRDAVPKYLETLRTQREILSRAIEVYHSQLGFYPPNHASNGGEVNTLYYELVGTRWNTNYQTFGIPTAKETISPDTLQKAFNMRAFSNSMAFPEWPTNFLKAVSFVGRKKGEVIMLRHNTPTDLNADVDDDFEVTPWRFAADPAQHNPGKFDLWIEFGVLGQHYIVKNWDDFH